MAFKNETDPALLPQELDPKILTAWIRIVTEFYLGQPSKTAPDQSADTVAAQILYTLTKDQLPIATTPKQAMEQLQILKACLEEILAKSKK